MKPKKLIEVAMPIKEISAESVRDKSIRHGHISTLHLWWARRPLPACRAIVFASLVPDPLDEHTPNAFKEAVTYLLDKSDYNHILYKPYPDIPYTAIVDPMEDNLRNRLMMFIGKFSDKCQEDMIAGKTTTPKEQLSAGSLIKWENKNNPKVLRIARELIWVAYNSDINPELSFEKLHKEFDTAYDAIPQAEERLYSIPNRHLGGPDVEKAQRDLDDAIASFQSRMPSVFDPFAGGGAIPLEAARLGCRSFGNDINPVAHIIERASAEFPQKYGKPITYTLPEFKKRYGNDGIKLAEEKGIAVGDIVEIPNRLAFDVEYYAKRIISQSEKVVNNTYATSQGNIPAVTYWCRFGTCSNCHSRVPLLKNLLLSSPRSNKKSERIKHFHYDVIGKKIVVSVKNGKPTQDAIVNRGNTCCPICGAITPIDELKDQFIKGTIIEKPIALIFDNGRNKTFESVSEIDADSISKQVASIQCGDVPQEFLSPNSAGGDILIWGFKHWGELFNNRQLNTINALLKELHSLELENSEYGTIIQSYQAILIDRIALRMTSFGKWHYLQDTVEHLYGRQAIQMNYDYPELNPFSLISSAAENQLQSIINVIEDESQLPFSIVVENISSGDSEKFEHKSLTAVITDPPYYDAIAYADISDFFYVWMKRALSISFPLNFATPQTPKKEECVALKHYHNGDYDEAKRHFENKLTQILSSIEHQTSDIVSIMFAHQTTEAWTTLCNSILDSKMNITGSWPLDTEVSNALKANKGYLESSVTVSCRPSQRRGYGEFKEVKKDIERKVKKEVDSLYELGFRGADLLTACFGQAVSEFGKYESVEKADGSEVSVAELLEMVRQSAFDALLQGVKADDVTRFYIGWLQLNGMAECDFDDATKFTRVGVNVEINDIIAQHILIREGNKVRLATADEHITGHNQGMHPDQPLIDQVHRAITLFRNDLDKEYLLKLIKDCAPDASDQFWRVLATLKEMLPANEDLKAVQGLLQVQETLRTECQKDHTASQGSLFDFE